MKHRIQQSIAAVLLTFGLASPSQASVTCIAPEPTCVVVLLGALVTGFVTATDDQETGKPQAALEGAATEAVLEAIENGEDDRLSIRIRNAAGNRPGLETIVDRFERGRDDGGQGLSSLMDRHPQLFDDLDRFAIIIEQNAPRVTMTDAYGPRRSADGRVNWSRYAVLAQGALMIRTDLLADTGAGG